MNLLLRRIKAKEYTMTVPNEATMKYSIRVCESDCLGLAGPVTLFNLFQEAAWDHYRLVENETGALLEPHMIWAMTRVEMKLNRYAKWQEELLVTTWSRGIQKISAFRDFEIKDLSGALIAAGSATWVVLNTKTGRPEKLNLIAEKFPSQPGKSALSKDADKIDSPVVDRRGTPFEVRYSDMDVNRHVNSGRYLSWMSDSFGREFLENRVISGFTVNYAGEAVPGDMVFICRQDISESETLLNVVRLSDSRELARVKFSHKSR